MTDDSTDQPDSPRRSRQEPRRRELLDAAVAYVIEHGLDGLSIRPLATELGIGHRTLLYYFGTKEDLIAEILAEFRWRDRHVLDVQKVILATSGPGRAITAVWKVMSEPGLLPYWRFFFEAYGYALREPLRHTRFLTGIVSDWLEVIEGHLVDAGCKPDRAEPLAAMVLATFRGLVLDLVATGDRDRTTAAANELARLVKLALV